MQGEIIQILYLGGIGQGQAAAPTGDGRVRVSVLLDASTLPLTAEITSLSAGQMGLREGQMIYATFKATEARAYT